MHESRAPLAARQDRPPIGILGAGAWGTALAVHYARAGRAVRLWARSEAAVVQLRAGENAAYLPGVALPSGLEPTGALGDLIDCEPIFLAVPSHGCRLVVRDFLAQAPRDEGHTLISATKGIEGGTLARMSEVCFEEATRAGCDLHFAVLSGPSFASEVVAGFPTAVVLAAEEPRLALRLQRELSGGSLRLYNSNDIIGVELGGAAKNVVAIAAGVVTGLQMGHNTIAALITRGLHEMTRLGVACGGQTRTLSGLAGLGDLVLTCTGGPSRNRRTGIDLAHGRHGVDMVRDSGSVAEGVRTSKGLLELARRRRVQMPITEQMVAVLYDDKPPKEAVEELMQRDLKAEAEL